VPAYTDVQTTQEYKKKEKHKTISLVKKIANKILANQT
jgi:hypothetical protein